MAWSAAQYTKFEAERTRPVRDLIAEIPNQTARAVADLGCGPGNSTELLRDYFPEAEVTGIDSSADMIATAEKRLPGIRFETADIATWGAAEGSLDVILANAALQWVPDHARLLPFLMAKLAPGGTLAVQIPDNLLEPAHLAMRDVAADPIWADKLAKAGRGVDSRHDAPWYYATLRATGAAVDVWRTVYHHPLAGPAAVVEWFKGSALRPYLAALSEPEQATFLTRYEAAITAAYPPQPDGTVLLPFPRLFFVATREG